LTGGAEEDQPMPTKTRRDDGKSNPTEAKKGRSRRDADWDERLRLVGDARFVDVVWSGRDDPCWPLPKRQAD
jgi:hypothetical protein